MVAREPLPGFRDAAPRDRYCDLVLTGGVTSAIAYPAAIFALAMAYRFHSIGGSSSGAGAAALAAAAEYRRRHGSPEGFRILLERTAAVADEVQGRPALAWLFQPEAGQGRLFRALVSAVATSGEDLASAAAGVVRAYAVPLLSGAVATIALVALISRCWPQGALGWVGGALVGAVIGFAVALTRDVLRMVRNGYGLCSGMQPSTPGPHPPLIEWLHGLLQEIAGRPVDGPPLTFADLHAAPGSPHETMGDPGASCQQGIRLQMFAANVTHRRPYLLPQQGDDPTLYFRPCELRGLFPPSVVAHMLAKSPGRHTGSVAAGAADADPDAAWWELPRQDLPIVFAARLSVSFPVLFSAVPLWAPEFVDGRQTLRRCLFSDGGLCANFPIHLFDSAVPAWPTFGVALREAPARPPQGVPLPWDDTDRDRRERAIAAAVSLPQDHREGAEDHGTDFDTRPGTFARLKGFAGALLATMKDWNHEALSRLPGVRERVVPILLPHGIGGLNILMSSNQIRFLAALGREAGKQLLKRYSSPGHSSGMADGWADHRWVRFNILHACLARHLSGLTWSATRAPYALPIGAQIRAALDEAPLADEKGSSLNAAQAAALEGALAALMQAEQALRELRDVPYQPHPRPELQVRPPL